MKQLIEFKRLQNTLEDMGNALGEKYRQNLTDSERNASYNLFNSIKSRVYSNGYEFEVELSMKYYWEFIENGTRPHRPPYNKILEWVVAKKLVPYPMKNGKLPTAPQLAWMITNKIEREGTEGKPDFKNALTEIDYWEQRIEDALDEDVLDCLEELIAF